MFLFKLLSYKMKLLLFLVLQVVVIGCYGDEQRKIAIKFQKMNRIVKKADRKLERKFQELCQVSTQYTKRITTMRVVVRLATRNPWDHVTTLSLETGTSSVVTSSHPRSSSNPPTAK